MNPFIGRCNLDFLENNDFKIVKWKQCESSSLWSRNEVRMVVIVVMVIVTEEGKKSAKK